MSDSGETFQGVELTAADAAHRLTATLLTVTIHVELLEACDIMVRGTGELPNKDAWQEIMASAGRVRDALGL